VAHTRHAEGELKSGGAEKFPLHSAEKIRTRPVVVTESLTIHLTELSGFLTEVSRSSGRDPVSTGRVLDCERSLLRLRPETHREPMQPRVQQLPQRWFPRAR